MFTGMGLEGFAQRAERELLAPGERPRERTAETRDNLTAQEAHIARLVRDGLSNPEIEARLSISPRTAEYHLYKVFNKLGITSRNEPAVGGERGRCPPRPRLVRLAVWRGTRTLIPQSAHCRRGGEGEADGFELAEEDPIEAGETGVLWVEPVRAAFPPESGDGSGSTYGEADHELSSELSDTTGD